MRLIILDPNLEHTHGHHALYDRTLANEAKQRGVDVSVIGNLRFKPDAIGGAPVYPLLESTSYRSFSDDPNFGRLENVQIGNRVVFDEMQELPKDFFRPDDLVLVHTVSHINIKALVDWIGTFPARGSPTFCICLMLPSGIEIVAGDKYRVVDLALASAYREAFIASKDLPDLFFMATGHQHAREFSALAGFTIPAHPLITTFDETPPSEVVQTERILLFAGDAKINKGLGLLPEIVRQVCPAYPSLQFHIHANPGPAWGRAVEVVKELEALAPHHSNLELKLSALSGGDYAELISSSAIIALPYDPVEYRLKSSGVVWESIASNSTLIVPAQTWLARECAHWQCAYESFAGNDAAAVSAAISRAISAGAAHVMQAREASRRFVAANGVKALVDIVVEQLPPRSIPLGEHAAQSQRVGASALSGPGWHELEQYREEEVRWSAGEAGVPVVFSNIGDWRVTLSGPYCFGEEQLRGLEVFVDGAAAAFDYTLAEGNAWTVSLVFRETDPTMPKRTVRVVLGETHMPGSDSRKLGLLCSGVEIREQEGADRISDVIPTPVSSRFRAVEGDWTEAVRFASWTFRNRPATDGVLSFSFDAPSADIAIDTQVFIGGQRAQTRFVEKKGVWQAQTKIDAAKISRSDYLTADIVFTLPHRVRMNRIKWRDSFGAMIGTASQKDFLPPAQAPADDAVPVPEPQRLDVRDRTSAQWSFGEVEHRGNQKYVEIAVAGLKTGDETFLDFSIKLHVTDTSYVVELRESRNALALIRGLNQSMLERDNWGAALRLSVNKEGQRTGPPLSRLGEDVSGVRVMLKELPAGIRKSSIEDMDSWIEAAVRLGRLLGEGDGQSEAPVAPVSPPEPEASPPGVEWSCSIVSDVEDGSVAKFRVSGFQLDDRTLDDFSFRVFRFTDSYALQLTQPEGGYQLLEQPKPEFLGENDWEAMIILSVDHQGKVLGPRLGDVAMDARGVSQLLRQFLGGIEDCDVPDAQAWKRATEALAAMADVHV